MPSRLSGPRTASLRAASSRRPLTVMAAAAKVKAQPMVCLDCGYIYDGDQAFAELGGGYKCPVCTAPKKRFQELPGAGKGNDAKSMSARREKLRKKIESEGGKVEDEELLLNTLLTYGGITVALFGALYVFLSQRTAGL